MTNKTVLVVEDEQPQRAALLELISNHGYQVLSAESGPQGLHLAREHRPDLVLMNVALPGYDGVAATDQIKSFRATEYIPVVIVSGMNAPDDVSRAQAAGCDEYLFKPVDPDALLAVIHRFIGPPTPATG
jgi:CheY-like chemotaxis protein